MLSTALHLKDNTDLHPHAQIYDDGVICSVHIGPHAGDTVTIQATSPIALRRLAYVLVQAATSGERLQAKA